MDLVDLFDFIPDGRRAREWDDWYGRMLDVALYGDEYVIMPSDGSDSVKVVHLY